MYNEIKEGCWVLPKDSQLLYKVLTTQYGLAYADANMITNGTILFVADVTEHSIRIKGWSMQLPKQMFKKYQPPVVPAEKPAERPVQVIDLTKFYQVASTVKPHSKESVVLHMSAEVGEVAECLVQPQRNGDIVEESVDVILCALDVIYLELGQTHGTEEITAIINKKMDAKSEKWLNTCKR